MNLIVPWYMSKDDKNSVINSFKTKIARLNKLTILTTQFD